MPSDWTPVEDAMSATLPPPEVQRLTGRPLRCIFNRRVWLNGKGTEKGTFYFFVDGSLDGLFSPNPLRQLIFRRFFDSVEGARLGSL